jgi:hypothetical protein
MIESKILKALHHAVGDGNIYQNASGNAAFGLQGALAFIETLVGLCDADERETLFVDWIVNDASATFVKDFFSQMVARSKVNFLTSHMEVLAEKLLAHYGTDVDRLLSANRTEAA